MKKLNSRGFGIVQILMIIILLAAIIAAGVYVYKSKNKPASKRLGAITNFDECVQAGNPIMESYPEQCAADGKTFSNPNQKVETPVTDQMKYFEIKELGVKFEQTVGLEDLYYYYKPGTTWVYFSLNSLKNTDCAANKTAQVALSKYTQAEAEADPASAGILQSQKINGNYYMAAGGQAYCSDNEAIQVKATKMRQDVTAAVNKGLIALE